MASVKVSKGFLRYPFKLYVITLKCSRNLYRYKKLFIPSSQPLTINTKSSALDVAAVLDPPLVWLNKTRKGLDEDL